MFRRWAIDKTEGMICFFTPFGYCTIAYGKKTGYVYGPRFIKFHKWAK